MKELWRNKDGNIEIQCTHDEDKIIRRSKMKPQNHSSLPSSPFYENKIKVGILLCLFVMLLTIFAVEITNIMMPIINNSDNIDNYSVYDNGNEEVSQESLENSEESTTIISKTSVKNLCDRTLSSRRIRSVKSQQKHRQKKYVVAHETRFVSCSRFKPTTKDKYLVSPSLDSLHTCYKYGVRSNELEKGITTNKDDELRYDLDYLYIPCEVVFNENLDELTDQLKDDYERCKWSGGLSREQQLIVENKFAVELATADQNDVPGNLENTTTSPAPLEPRAFVECSHVETELVEDYFESPSYEALHRCEKLGVTSKELERGIGINPQPKKRRFDVGNLYMSCMDMFISELNYMTSELKDDYRRCKKVGAITKEVQDTVETKFYETLYEERGTATEKIAERPLTTTTSTPFVYESTTAEATTAAKTTMMTGTTTTTATATKRPRINRYSFANCKPIENKTYLVCIKIIKVYSLPIEFSQLDI